jgi:hypothetical protein
MELVFETFNDLVGMPFTLTDADGVQVPLVLDSALPLTRRGHPEHLRSPFSLIFSGPAAPFCPQAIYGFNHDAVGSFEMTIVPIGQLPESKGFLYQALFN